LWSLIIDCISLYQVLVKFNNLIFKYFKINIHKYPTLSSLAFAIFRTHFLKADTIPQLLGKVASDIREGYTGGAVDVYIPFNEENTNIYCYDVNSLYPSVMQNFEMPVGKPTLFYGDIRKVDPKAFGFFYCKIKTPDNLMHPILQTHVKTEAGERTIAPLGRWEDMILSAEMDNAIKFGYKFNILWGYTFEKGYIFSDYVDFLYNFRLNYPKSNPLNYIAKILLNSLYGRFGMDDNFTEVNIIHKDYFPDFENKFFDNIISKTKLDDYFLVEIKNPENLNEDQDSTHNINVSIAAAITAYTRIHMSQFKNNPKINLYYTDTDSAYTDSELDDDLISSTVLGKLKLENISDKAIFLAPKVYCLNTENNGLIYKVKGLKHEIELTMNDFENLLYKDVFLEKSQTKWFKNIEKGHISVLEQIYTLKVTDNKRELIYDKNNKLINTKPYIINNKKDISS
jgi:DNA polymerase type B, organellar and viral